MEDVAPSLSSTYAYGMPSAVSAQQQQQSGSITPPADRLSPTFHQFSMPPHSLSSSPTPQHSHSLSTTPPPHPHSPTPTTLASQMTNAQITQLIEDLRNTDLSVRLNSFRKIQVISHALGTSRTRSELIPYLNEFCDEDDEILLILASMLGEMIEAVGGPEYAYVLLPPLEQLIGSEETAVREKAVASLGKIIEQISEATLNDSVVPLLRRCSNADWFTSRISATSLFPLIYSRVTDEKNKKELRALYGTLCKKEETPMVKRAAAANLGAFASILDSRILMTEFHTLLLRLSRDEIDSVRLLIVQSCVQILRVYVKDQSTRQENIDKMKPILLALADDSSWRVRYMLADKMIELCATIVSTGSTPNSSNTPSPSPAASSASASPVPQSQPPSNYLRDEELIDCFMKLLDDPELEVRTSATLKSGEFGRLIGPQKALEKFFGIDAKGKPIPISTSSQVPTPGGSAPRQHPPLKNIVMDPSPSSLHTKSALASVILQFTSVLGAGLNVVTPPGQPTPNALIIEHLLPLILSLLSDDHAEVRLVLLGKLGEEGSSGQSTGSPLTIEVLSSSLLPALAKLSTDTKWRVRLNTIQLLPSLAAFFQEELFHTKLFDLVLSWLNDSVWSIREAAITNLVKLTQLFGREWCRVKLLPKILLLASDKSYVYRLTAVFCMRDLASQLGGPIVTEQILPILATPLSTDPVPNVRFNVAKLLGQLSKDGLIVGSEQQGVVDKVLAQMKEDTDGDVKYSAIAAIREAQTRTQLLTPTLTPQTSQKSILNQE